MSACARVMATRTVCGTHGVDRRSPRGFVRAHGVKVRAIPAGRLVSRVVAHRRWRAEMRMKTRATLDAEGIPWNIPEDKKGKGAIKAPPGLSLEQFPGETLPELADRLEAAVESSFGDRMYEECVVDMTPFGIEECYGDVANAVAEVVVAANAAETAGKFNMALRRKELRRLRAALWELRLTLEKHGPGSCTMSIRHRLESLRSASLDVCHPQMRAADAPNATAIPNFQTVHLDFQSRHDFRQSPFIRLPKLARLRPMRIDPAMITKQARGREPVEIWSNKRIEQDRYYSLPDLSTLRSRTQYLRVDSATTIITAKSIPKERGKSAKGEPTISILLASTCGTKTAPDPMAMPSGSLELLAG